MSAQDNVRALLYAWQELKKYRKLLRWSWTSRGLVSKDEMKEMNPDQADGDSDYEGPGNGDGPTPKLLVPDIPVLVPTLGPQ